MSMLSERAGSGRPRGSRRTEESRWKEALCVKRFAYSCLSARWRKLMEAYFVEQLLEAGIGPQGVGQRLGLQIH
jgi:hypothetical protein